MWNGDGAAEGGGCICDMLDYRSTSSSPIKFSTVFISFMRIVPFF
jgi:hypothetical protein